jgi:hypothetical protein
MQTENSRGASYLPATKQHPKNIGFGPRNENSNMDLVWKTLCTQLNRDREQALVHSAHTKKIA